MSSIKPLTQLLSKLDVSEVFKTKGNLRRWSAKRTIGGLIAVTACNDILVHGMSWQAVTLCAISVLPLSISVFGKES